MNFQGHPLTKSKAWRTLDLAIQVARDQLHRAGLGPENYYDSSVQCLVRPSVPVDLICDALNDTEPLNTESLKPGRSRFDILKDSVR
jgi:hypothetical protein